MGLVHATAAMGQRVTLTELMRLGGEGRATGLEFGLPVAVALDGDRTWVADLHDRKIWLHDPKRDAPASIGRMGRGPAEFMEPISLATIRPGVVAALDNGNARIAIIELQDGRPTVARVIPLTLAGSSAICARNEVLFVLGSASGRILHELDASGRIVRSFGEPFRTDHPLLAAVGNRGRLICNTQAPPGTAAFLVASEEHGIVRAYNAAGTLTWEVTIPSFRPISITFPARGGVLYSMPPEGSYHQIVALSPVPGGEHLQVQVAAIDKSMRIGLTEAFEVVTHVLSSRTGREVTQRRDLPRIDALSGDRAAGIDNSMIPLVRVFRVGSTGRQ